MKPTLNPLLPRALRDVVERALAIAPDMREAFERHYHELMPRMRDEQLAHPLMRATLHWDRLPRLRGAIERVAALLPHARGALDATSLAELHVETYYGGCMPMLYAYPADLAYFMSRDLGLDATIDRYLTAPVVHELCHGERDRASLNPHLDECIAGWLGVHVLPEFAYPAPGEDDAIYASPWLAQIGAALVRAFGIERVLRAHAGDATALPVELVRNSDTLYWDVWSKDRPLHLLADTMNPRPWLELIGATRDGDAAHARERGATHARERGATHARDGTSSGACDGGATHARNSASSDARDGDASAACDRGATHARNSASSDARNGGSVAARDGGASAARDGAAAAARDGGASHARNGGAVDARNSASSDARDGGAVAARDRDGGATAPRADDRRIVEDALRAMCLETTLVAGSFRTRTVTPVTVRVVAAADEPWRGYVTADAKNAHDMVAPWHWAPVRETRTLVIERIEDIPALAAALVR